MTNALVDGILLLYFQPLVADAPTILEHVEALQRFSSFKVWPVNVDRGFPKSLERLRFRTVLLHYSLFGTYPFRVSVRFYEYLKSCHESLVIAFFQDEYQYCRERCALIDELRVKAIFTLLDPAYFDQVYSRRTEVERIEENLTGYVSEALVRKAAALAKPVRERTIDVSYRARQLPFFMGRGAQEKTAIAEGFCRVFAGKGLKLDIETGEQSRFAGDDWYRFLGNSRFALGVEAGVSVFDLDGTVRQQAEEFMRTYPQSSFEDVHANVLAPYDELLPYRTISPRVFEAAAFGVVPIMFTGHYNGVVRPDLNYIELKKDFSNVAEVHSKMQDERLCEDIRQANFSLVSPDSEYRYEKFVPRMDRVVRDMSGIPAAQIPAGKVDEALAEDRFAREVVVAMRRLRHAAFPGRKLVRSLYRRLVPLVE